MNIVMRAPSYPVTIGTGTGTSGRELAEALSNAIDSKRDPYNLLWHNRTISIAD
jgi:hypothetical protein